MYLAWGGLPFRVTRVLSFEGEAVLDPSGTDYLHSNYTVAVEMVLSRTGDGYRVALNGEEGPVPQFVNGLLARTQTATLSIAAIRHALAQRAPFVLWEQNPVTGAADVLLASDSPDVQNGPTPIKSIVLSSIHGQGNTAFVQFVFSAAIRECPLVSLAAGRPPALREIRTASPKTKNAVTSKDTKRSSSDPKGGVVGGEALVHAQRQHAFDGTALAAPRGRLLLSSINGRTPILSSNRWTTTTAIEETNESTVTVTRGLAIFNRQGLQLLDAASVEQFTRSLVPPLVPNCVREVRELTVSADGLAMQWEIADREVPRGYIDFPCVLNNGRVRVVNPNGPPRYVAGVSLMSKRDFTQPAVASGAFAFFDFLSTVNFANEANDGAAAEDVAQDIPVIGDFAKFLGGNARRLGNRALAAARTVDTLLPSLSEFAASEVRGTREARMSDLQSLAIALCAGALGQGNGTVAADEQQSRNKRFALLPPATQFTIEADHVNAIVRCTLAVTRSGLADFCLGETQSSINRMLQPLPDDIVGGRAVVGIFNVLDAIGLLPSFVDIGGLLGTPAGATKLIDGTVVNKYAEQLLLTASDAILRGPTGDGLSRSLSANLIRAAAALLRPCEIPSGPTNQYLALPETQIVVEQQGTGVAVAETKAPANADELLKQFRSTWNTESTLRPK